MSKKESKFIVVRVHEELHKKIKLLATEHGVTIKKYILDAVAHKMDKDAE